MSKKSLRKFVDEICKTSSLAGSGMPILYIGHMVANG